MCFWIIYKSVNSKLPEQSYNTEAYEELMEFLSRNSLNDGDKFCADLMRESSRHQALGMSMSKTFEPYKKLLLISMAYILVFVLRIGASFQSFST